MLKLHIKPLLILSVTAALLASCSKIPPEAYYEHGSPESLMDTSSEVVNFDLGSGGGTSEMSNWISNDQPTRAELYCTEGAGACADAQQVLDQFSVPTTFVPSAENTVALVYERVLARDCENRYIDNSVNPYNLDHPTYGCSTASNIVQMVTDKRQITSPALSDYPSGERVQRVMEGYRKPYNDTAINLDVNLRSNTVGDIGSIGQ
jgi:hypothetical protein